MLSRIYDRAVELWEIGSSKEKTLSEIEKLRNELIEDDKKMLLNAGYKPENVEKEVADVSKKLKGYSDKIIDDLY